MDLSTITDINELKAMAYDHIAENERITRNLQAINARIQELSEAQAKETPKSTKK